VLEIERRYWDGCRSVSGRGAMRRGAFVHQRTTFTLAEAPELEIPSPLFDVLEFRVAAHMCWIQSDDVVKTGLKHKLESCSIKSHCSPYQS